MNWGDKVKIRDGYKCVICGKPANNAHHLLYKGYFPEYANDVDNGITVCRRCHIAVHRGTFVPNSPNKPGKADAIKYLLACADGNPVDPALLDRIVDADIKSTNEAINNPPPRWISLPPRKLSAAEIRAREKYKANYVPGWRKTIDAYEAKQSTTI